MKRPQQFTLAALFIMLGTACGTGPDEPAEHDDARLRGTISMSGAFALYPLAVKWGEEFTKINPDVRFDIQGGGAGKGMTDMLAGSVQLGMISRTIGQEELAKGAYPMAVAKDAVLATVSSANPHMAALKARGVTKEDLENIWIKGTVKTWGDLLGNGSSDVISVYTRSDAAGAPETWAKFLGGAQEDLQGVGVFGDPGLADAVTKDPLGIGFNNVNYVYDIHTQQPFPTLAVVPLDLDGSRSISPNEDLYSTLDVLNAAIVDGIYPSPPARPLYFTTLNAPKDPLLLAFLGWVLTDGQRFVPEAGYVPLPKALVEEEYLKLKGVPAPSVK
ncbi:MAG: PstS family phosphate ABC transporter substrate-binding protein [Flavobacteriales bacterium]